MLTPLVILVLAAPPGTLELQRSFHEDTGRYVRSGTYTVWENRAERTGRTIELELVVVEAEDADARRPDPVFFIAGGPGQAAARMPWMFGHAFGVDRDLVFLSQRGTGGSNGLQCPAAPQDDMWDPERFAACRDELAKRADLTQYTTPIAADDLNDVRAALGYDQINLVGGSYGTRFSLVYMRRHPETVRAAVLEGVAPVSFRNPLYHAREAQRAVDLVFAACADDPDCAEAHPRLEAKLDAVLTRLDAFPVDASAHDPATGELVSVHVTRGGFASTLRFVMYGNTSDVPWLVHESFKGNFDPIAERMLATRASLGGSIAMGMLLSVVCAEDVARIDPNEIEALTADTFLGDGRVREQMAACAIWPTADVGPEYAEPVTADVPTLVISGQFDPVTSPFWGAEAASHLPRALHVVVPQTHALGGPCVESMIHAFLDAGTIEELDTDCVTQMRLPRFR